MKRNLTSPEKGDRVRVKLNTIKKFFCDFSATDVYTAKIPCNALIKSDLYPKERNEEISECGSEKVRAEKYFVWKLLEYAVKNSFGYNIKELKFKKTENGKLLCDKCCFSLSHSFGAVAVAVSKNSVGVDIELLNGEKARVIEKTLSLSEKAELEKNCSQDKQNALICFWTAKESIYKNNGTGGFKPSETDVTKNNVQTKTVKIGEKDYALSVCSDSLKAVRYFENINL